MGQDRAVRERSMANPYRPVPEVGRLAWPRWVWTLTFATLFLPVAIACEFVVGFLIQSIAKVLQ